MIIDFNYNNPKNWLYNNQNIYTLYIQVYLRLIYRYVHKPNEFIQVHRVAFKVNASATPINTDGALGQARFYILR